ncbi:hypothetical protein AOQ84DRAFT_411016 [Glonium stellatum]|uniref:Uncharacterized protein n=1 Tax=Glonium stellatum TaxID=574774 RepID=A0A8E2JRG9_9PEZI|nr:hypothetical protein AOQ84DRAFT_411016 [Glonium stellatum]
MADEKNIQKSEVRITAVVVTEPHHTRFYSIYDEDKALKNFNCLGNFLEAGGTFLYYIDFFLQAHNGL